MVSLQRIETGRNDCRNNGEQCAAYATLLLIWKKKAGMVPAISVHSLAGFAESAQRSARNSPFATRKTQLV